MSSLEEEDERNDVLSDLPPAFRPVRTRKMRKQEKIRREKLKAVKPPPAETTKKEDAQAIAARRKLPPAAKTKKESYEVVEARRKLLHGKKAYRLKEQISDDRFAHLVQHVTGQLDSMVGPDAWEDKEREQFIKFQKQKAEDMERAENQLKGRLYGASGLCYLKKAIIMAAPDLDRKEIQNFFQAVTSTIPSADSVTETAARSENRKAMLREASNALKIPWNGAAMPSGSSDAAIHVILPWSPAFGKDHHMPDSVLVSELSTSRKLIEKGLNANITKVHTYNIIETRLSDPNWLDLPSYTTEPSTLAERWTSGRSMTAEQTTAISTQFEQSRQRIKAMVNDDTSQRKLCFTMGAFARDAIMESLCEGRGNAGKRFHFLSLHLPIPVLTAARTKHVRRPQSDIAVTLIIDDGKITQVYLHDTHSETQTFNRARNMDRYRAAFATDFCLNLLCTMAGINVPTPALSLFTKENYPHASDLTGMCESLQWAVTMSEARRDAQLAKIVQEDLQLAFSHHWRSRVESRTQPNSPRPYMVQVWQVLLDLMQEDHDRVMDVSPHMLNLPRPRLSEEYIEAVLRGCDTERFYTRRSVDFTLTSFEKCILVGTAARSKVKMALDEGKQLYWGLEHALSGLTFKLKWYWRGY